jgi:hypothetical protein
MRPCAGVILAVTILAAPAFAQSQILSSLVRAHQTPPPPGELFALHPLGSVG